MIGTQTPLLPNAQARRDFVASQAKIPGNTRNYPLKGGVRGMSILYLGVRILVGGEGARVA